VPPRLPQSSTDPSLGLQGLDAAPRPGSLLPCRAIPPAPHPRTGPSRGLGHQLSAVRLTVCPISRQRSNEGLASQKLMGLRDGSACLSPSVCTRARFLPALTKISSKSDPTGLWWSQRLSGEKRRWWLQPGLGSGDHGGACGVHQVALCCCDPKCLPWQRDGYADLQQKNNSDAKVPQPDKGPDLRA